MCDDALTYGETNTGARHLPATKPLENLKNALVVLGGNARPVVLYGEDPIAFGLLCGYMHVGRPVTAVFNGIADEVLQELREVRAGHANFGKRVVGHLSLRQVDGRLEGLDHD